MKKSSVSRMQRFFVFSDSVLCLGKMNQTPASNSACEEKLSWFKSSSQYRTLDTVCGEPMEFEWNISQDSPHCKSATKSMSSCPKWAIHQYSKDELSSCRCSMMSFGDPKTMKGNAMLTPTSCVCICKKIPTRTLVIPRTWIRKRSGILLVLTDHKENGTESLNR